jgi:hypothetical protein
MQSIYNLEYNVSLIYLGEYIDNYNLLLILNDTPETRLYFGRVNYKKNKNFNSNQELLNSLCKNEDVEFLYDESEFELLNKNLNIHLQFETVLYNRTLNINLENQDNILDLFLLKFNFNHCICEREDDKLIITVDNIKLSFLNEQLSELYNYKYLLEANIKTKIRFNNNKVKKLYEEIKLLKIENDLFNNNFDILFNKI